MTRDALFELCLDVLKQETWTGGLAYGQSGDRPVYGSGGVLTKPGASSEAGRSAGGGATYADLSKDMGPWVNEETVCTCFEWSDHVGLGDLSVLRMLLELVMM